MTGRLARAAALALGLGLGLSATRAGAQADEDPAAAQFFRAGLAAYERHEYRAAALAFEEADRHIPRAAAMYNAGRAWQAAGDAARAADAFAAALRGKDLTKDEEGRARKGLSELEPSLGQVAVTGPSSATLFFDEMDRGSLPRTVHARVGAHDVRVRRRDGSDVTRHVIVLVGQTESIAVEDVAPVSEVEIVEVPAKVETPPVAPSARRRWPFRPWGYASFAATGAFGIAGIVTYAEFLSKRSQFDGGGDHDQSLHDTAEACRTATYVLWGVGAAFAVAGVVLVALPISNDGRSSGLLLGPGGVSMRGSF
jgi:tetratricopeptide (TPR) repeat protein